MSGDITLVDQGAIVSLTPEGMLRQVVSEACPAGETAGSLQASPTRVAYSQDGQLVVVDDKNLVHRQGTDGRWKEVAGSLAHCKRSGRGCLLSEFEEAVTVASKARFVSLGGVAVGPDGTIFVVDTERHHVRSIGPARLQPSPTSGRLELLQAGQDELLEFSPAGRHLATRGLYGGPGLTFLYAGPLLAELRDGSGNTVELERAAGRLVGLTLNSRHRYRARLDKAARLEQLVSPAGLITTYRYGSGGLLARRLLDRTLHTVWLWDGLGGLVDKLSTASPAPPSPPAGNTELVLTAQPSPLIETLFPGQADSQSINMGLSELADNETLHVVRWEHFAHARTRAAFGPDVDGIGKRLVVNGELAFTSELHPRSQIQSLYDAEGAQLLKVEQYGVPRRTILIPRNLPAVELTFDPAGRPDAWSWGQQREQVTIFRLKAGAEP